MSEYEIKVYWKKLGGHIHCRVFAGKRDSTSKGLCGTLVFADGAEWTEAEVSFECGGFTVIKEGDTE